MKKISAIVLFICINALLIFFQVHKQSQFIKLSHDIQTYQKKLEQLQQKKRQLRFQTHTHKQPDNIKKFAQEQLNMKSIPLKKVKNINEL